MLLFLLKKRLWHRCVPVNFVKFPRAPFLQNTSGWLLLYSYTFIMYEFRWFTKFWENHRKKCVVKFIYVIKYCWFQPYKVTYKWLYHGRLSWLVLENFWNALKSSLDMNKCSMLSNLIEKSNLVWKNAWYCLMKYLKYIW